MTYARALTPDGIRRAQEFVRAVRDDSNLPLMPPDDILFDARYSREIERAPKVEHRDLTTRRKAAEYIASLSPRPDQRSIDDWPFWSWLGLWHLPDVLCTEERRSRMSAEAETFVVDVSRTDSERSHYRHYLWASWRLYEAFGKDVAFLLDRDVMEIGDIARRIINSPRIFNSVGVPQLILRLYTRGTSTKRGHTNRPGGLAHLLRVLPQLELTHDVYGMSPDALLRILPPEFQEWDER